MSNEEGSSDSFLARRAHLRRSPDYRQPQHCTEWARFGMRFSSVVGTCAKGPAIGRVAISENQAKQEQQANGSATGRHSEVPEKDFRFETFVHIRGLMPRQALRCL